MTTISFRGGEGTGSVADRRIDTAKQEGTGSVGARKNQESIFTIDNELKQDTVCFKANPESERNTSVFGTALKVTAGVLLLGGLLGLANKYDVVGKISNEKVQKFFRHTDVVTKPCRDACAWIKHNSYDKLAKLFNNKK